MKTRNTLRTAVLLGATSLFVACSGFKGSASDRTGTNGATNGTGKVMSTSAHDVKN
ncbi:hypothetical protein [Flavobacterium sp.]|uniref:hypothetical protein n=1 Tax=Flavobacterium sp. TaxID=239 RepID=UPI0025C050DF|nr:hypothetical protein [Flavobacterium sp.]